MKGPSIVARFDGRLICPYCGTIVGQVDPAHQTALSTTPVGVPMVLEQKHDAPCSLRCAGSAERYWHEAQDGLLMHTGNHTCMLCKPRPCPICAGSKTMLVSLYDAIHLHTRQHIFQDSATQLPIETQKRMTITITCTRCKGTGLVDGLSA